MARRRPSAIPPGMYRHFAVFTVLLTASIAMFADGENRELHAAEVSEQQAVQAQREAEAAELARAQVAPPATGPRRRSSPESSAFDVSFGAPMEVPSRSVANFAAELLPDAGQAGFPEQYLASLESEQRTMLLDGLEKEGLLAPGERERRSAALVAASQVRSGGRAENY